MFGLDCVRPACAVSMGGAVANLRRLIAKDAVSDRLPEHHIRGGNGAAAILPWPAPVARAMAAPASGYRRPKPAADEFSDDGTMTRPASTAGRCSHRCGAVRTALPPPTLSKAAVSAREPSPGRRTPRLQLSYRPPRIPEQRDGERPYHRDTDRKLADHGVDWREGSNMVSCIAPTRGRQGRTAAAREPHSPHIE